MALRTGPHLAYVEQGPAHGEPVVLLHGYTDSSLSFAPLLPHLPGHWRVLAPDQRGHGASREEGTSYTMADYAADVVAFLDGLGIGRATLVGHSMGSLVAQIVASEHPHRVARLVLVGSMARGGNPATLGLCEDLRQFEQCVDEAFVRDFQRACLAGPVPEDFFAAVVANSASVPLRVWREALADLVLQDTTGRLAAITAPTLVLWGSQDGFFPREEQEELARGIAQCELRVIEGVGHCPNWERPRLVAGILARFAAAPAPPAGARR